jgi:hypothetical protein
LRRFGHQLPDALRQDVELGVPAGILGEALGQQVDVGVVFALLVASVQLVLMKIRLSNLFFASVDGDETGEGGCAAC